MQNQALKAGKRGRRPGEQKALDPRQEARVRRAVLGKYPDQVALPGLVWTRPQVRQLVRNWFGIGLSLVTIARSSATLGPGGFGGSALLYFAAVRQTPALMRAAPQKFVEG